MNSSVVSGLMSPLAQTQEGAGNLVPAFGVKASTDDWMATRPLLLPEVVYLWEDAKLGQVDSSLTLHAMVFAAQIIRTPQTCSLSIHLVTNFVIVSVGCAVSYCTQKSNAAS